MRPNPYLLRSTIVAALGGLLFGFDTAVISGATHALTLAYALSPTSLGMTVSSALVGTILGAMFAGIPGDRLGRRASLRVMALLYVASALGCAFAWGWYPLVLFRFIGGLGIGGSSVLGPMYIAEIAPAKWRGRLVGFFQFNIVSGHSAGVFLELPAGPGTAWAQPEWRWKLGVSAVPAVLFFADAVRHSAQPALAGARRAACRKRARCCSALATADVEAELQEIVASIDASTGATQEPLFPGQVSACPMFLAISIAMFNQLSGINAILYYLNDIFAQAGFSKVRATCRRWPSARRI